VKEGPELERRKYYVDGGRVEIVADVVHELDGDGKKLRVVTYIDYTAEKVRTLWPTGSELRKFWSDPISRDEVIEKLEERGILFEDLAAATKQPDADPFDLLCHVAYNAPLRTRRERAERLRREDKAFLDRYSPGARAILDELLEKYAEYGTAQFKIPDILKVPPISARGNVMEIAALFGGADALKSAVGELQTLLYAA
jgi:type I restriction enzyme R subunit